jgi:hypothetical protein
MTTTDLPDTGDQDGVSVLSWLRSVAERNQPADDITPTIIPVAWMGQTSTDDQQDPTLSLPRQLENSRTALPAPFVIVAKFYDIESGRNDLDFRGHGDAHERFDIPIARDGGIADLLAEAKRPDRRFVAVVCESIERVARVSYFSTKIEYELGQAGVALLAADEGIDPARVLPATGGSRPKQATQILTRRIKQAISEWYVVNMLEMSWDGFREHTRQGWNIANRRTDTSPSGTHTRSRPRATTGRSRPASSPTQPGAPWSPRSSSGEPWNDSAPSTSPTGSTPTPTATRHHSPSPARDDERSAPGRNPPC